MNSEETTPGCIYLITNLVNNKKYVGQSSKQDCNKRFETHWSTAKREDKNFTTKLYNAMRKYGKEAFKIETLCIVPRYALNNMELYWAEQLETYTWDYPGGYNMVWCGNQPWKGIKQSPELIKKRFAPLIGRKQEKDQIEKARNAKIKLIIEKGAKGIQLNKEQVLEIVNLVNEGKISRTKIAEKYDVQPSVITRIMSGERWSFVTGITFTPKEGPKRKELGLEKAREIREIYAKGDITYEKLGIVYGVEKSTVASIVKNKNYKE